MPERETTAPHAPVADASPLPPEPVSPIVPTESHASSPSVPSGVPDPPVPAVEDKPTASRRSKDFCWGCFTEGTERGGRNLVVCIDGTSNQFGMKNTNVVELYSRLEKSDRQLTFYNSGIGTYAEPSWKSWSYYVQVIANKLDLAFALRFEKIIISAYAWLVDNYQKGDRIFLFGFSRGAYQVRALSAMIQTVGLLHKGNDDQIPFAYELYAASGKKETSPSWIADCISNWCISNLGGIMWIRSHAEPLWTICRGLCRVGGKASGILFPGVLARCQTRLAGLFNGSQNRKMRLIPHGAPRPAPRATDITPEHLHEKFSSTFSRYAHVHFVGVWDTVSSVGVIRDKTLPMTTDGMRHVCFFRHALALHEYRVKFLPEYARGGDGPDRAETSGEKPHTKEVWFAGSHSDIGGGSSINTTLDKFGPALRWMSLEATIAGLKFNSASMKSEAVCPSRSMTPIWRLFECLPIKRLSYEDKDSITRWPHLCFERPVKQYQGIHQTASEDYTIEGLPKDVYEELDEWTTAGWFLVPVEYWKDRDTLRESDLETLNFLLNSDTGYRSLVDRQIYHHIDDQALACWKLRHDSENARQALRGLSLLRDGVVNRAYSSEWSQTIPLSAVLHISVSCGPDSFPFGLRDRERLPAWVKFTSQNLVVSKSWDHLRFWDTESGEPNGEIAFADTDGVCDITISQSGSLIATTLVDNTVRTWKLEAGSIISTGVVIRLPSDDFRTLFPLAFSPDGSRILIGADVGPQMWDTSTGERLGGARMSQYERFVWAIASSDDNKRIILGLDDGVRIWDTQTLPLGESLPGCATRARSVAFSPGGASIVAACNDYAVRIWDAETRQLSRTLIGHTNEVTSVAFSPSGKHCISAGFDNLIYIWDAIEGRAIGVLKGHTGCIRSVAWSPDGTRIVSGSDDGTVRVWDRIPVSDLFYET